MYDIGKLVLSLALATTSTAAATEKNHLTWKQAGDKYYWLEHGEIQGKPGDPKNIWDTTYSIERGREIYDPASDAWYWLDACYGGAKAVDKEVWMPYVYQNEKPGSTDGKWVRYDTNGAMCKGWTMVIKGINDYDNSNYGSKVYYYDYKTGAMLKGWQTIKSFARTDGIDVEFDEKTGVLIHATTPEEFIVNYGNAFAGQEITMIFIDYGIVQTSFIAPVPEKGCD